MKKALILLVASMALGVAVADSKKVQADFLEFRPAAKPFGIEDAQRLANEQFRQRSGLCGGPTFKERRFEAWIFETRIGYAGAKGPDIIVYSTWPSSAEGVLEELVKKKPNKNLFAEPRFSGGTVTVDAANDGSVIDIPRFDYVLTIEGRPMIDETNLVSFWPNDNHLEAICLRDPVTLKNLSTLFAPTTQQEPNRVPETDH